MKFSVKLVLIESPVQIRTFMKFIEIYGLKVSEFLIIVRLNGVEKNDSQILEILRKNSIKYNCFSVKRNSKLNVVIMSIRVLFLIAPSLCCNGSEIYIGDFFSKWMKWISKANSSFNIFYLDDGLSTIAAYNSALKDDKVLSFITEFNLESKDGCSIIPIKTRRKYKEVISNTCLVVGMPMVENAALANSDVYIEYLRKVKSEFKGFTLEYIPHRYEKSCNLHEIELLGYSVKVLDTSVEEYIQNIALAPSVIVSLYSTALIYLEQYYSNIIVYSFTLPLEVINTTFRNSADLSYSYIKNKTKIKQIEV